MGLPLVVSLHIARQLSRVPQGSLELSSCRLYTGCRWVDLQIPLPAFSRRCTAPHGSDSVLDFRCVVGRFTCVHLLSSHLPASSGRFLQQSLTTTAFWATAALPGLKPASARRLRGACPHLLYSTGKPVLRVPIHVAPAQIPSPRLIAVFLLKMAAGSHLQPHAGSGKRQ